MLHCSVFMKPKATGKEERGEKEGGGGGEKKGEEPGAIFFSSAPPLQPLQNSSLILGRLSPITEEWLQVRERERERGLDI